MFLSYRHLFLYSIVQYSIKLLLQEICHFAQSPAVTRNPAWQYWERKIKNFTRFFSKNRGVQGQRPGRAAHGAKLPLAAANETPARRSGRNPLSVQSAIRRWRNPWPQAMALAAPTGWTAGVICQPANTNIPPIKNVGRHLCAATGRQSPFSTGRLVPLCRAGACPRRRQGVPIAPQCGKNDTGYRKRSSSTTP